MPNDTDDWFSPETATFGDRLAAAREASGMSQAQLAKRLGVKTTTIKGWENDTAEPRANHLNTMAGLLNVSIMWLINGEGEGVASPDSETTLPAEVSELLGEIRELRSQFRSSAEKLGRLEKKLRVILKDQM